jgi:transposase
VTSPGVVMRGSDAVSGAMFSYVDAEARVPKDHLLRVIRTVVNAALGDLSAEFARLYSGLGRPSIPPERLLRALLLQAFYSIRSERQLMEQLDYNLLFRWFVGLGIDDLVWDVTVYTKNRDRLLAGEVAARFMAAVLGRPEVKALLSDEHFSVDGTLVEAWASLKSFRPKDGSGEPPGAGRNATHDFHGERRINATHASTTDQQAKLFRKGRGKEAKLSFMGHLLMENRSGLVVQAKLTEANGRAECTTALALVETLPGRHRITVGADKAYDAAAFIDCLRRLQATPHIARCITPHRSSNLDRRTTRHNGYGLSQRARKRIEEAFGWMKTIAGQGRTKLRGADRVGWSFTLAAAAYNLVRLPKLLEVPA